jgi:cytochrome o ubiquinol oxidase operon protein cyoD
MAGPRNRQPGWAWGYLTGLLLALALTALPFGVVHYQLIAGMDAVAVIAASAVLQVFVHFRWFLFLDRAPPREHLLALAFAAALVLVMVVGSLWIMTDLARRMM